MYGQRDGEKVALTANPLSLPLTTPTHHIQIILRVSSMNICPIRVCWPSTPPLPAVSLLYFHHPHHIQPPTDTSQSDPIYIWYFNKNGPLGLLLPPPLAAIQLPFHPAQPYTIGYLWSVNLIRAKITGEPFVRYTRSTYSTPAVFRSVLPAGIRSNSFYAGHNGGRGGDSDYVRMRNQLEGWWWWFGMHPQQL